MTNQVWKSDFNLSYECIGYDQARRVAAITRKLILKILERVFMLMLNRAMPVMWFLPIRLLPVVTLRQNPPDIL